MVEHTPYSGYDQALLEHQDRLVAARLEIIALEAERNRLAQELAESQAEVTGLRAAIEDVLPRIMTVWSNDQEWEVGFDGSCAEADLQAALAHPSPAALATGKLMEVVARVYEQWADPRCAYSVTDMGSALTRICEAYRSVEDVRSGQGHEDQPPAEPAEETNP